MSKILTKLKNMFAGIKKQILYISVPGILVILLIFFLLVKEKKTINNDLFSAVPTDAAMIAEIKNFQGTLANINSNNLIWKELKKFNYFRHLDYQIQFLDSISDTKNVFRSLFSNRFLLSSHVIGKDKIEHLLIFSDQGKHHAKEVLYFLQQYDTLISVKHRKYDDTKIHSVSYSFDNQYFNMCFCQEKGLFMASYSSLLIEKALRQLHSDMPITENKSFLKVAETAGKNEDGNIYINNNLLVKFIGSALNETYQNKWSKSKNLANWTELDLDLKNDIILLNGFTSCDDSASLLLNVFQRQHPQKIESFSILPANASAFIIYGISNFELFQEDFMKYHKKNGTFEQINHYIQRINNNYGLNVRNFINSIIDNEAGLVYLNEKNLELHENKFVLIKTKSGSIAEEKLNRALEKILEIKKEKKEAYISKVSIDDETTFTVYENPLGNFYENLFGDIFSGGKYEFITFFENYMIAANSKPALKRYIHYNILHKTIKTNTAFSEITDYLSNRGSFYFYSDIPASTHLLAQYLDKKISDTLKTHTKKLLKIRSVVYQLSADKDLLYNNLVCKYSDKYKAKPQTSWETLLDTVTRFKPVFVKNHYSKENEIFVQDLNNNCYLINEAGRILWKISLPGKIMSDVYQVDYYKNGKLQMLFNTKNKIYLIDRLGNPVENYPVKLRAPATNGVTLFDYNNNKKYRIFLACDNHKVYLYNIEGNIVKGWEFDKTDHTVFGDVQHFRIKEKDYIVFADKLKIYILDRKGNERVKPERYFPVSKRNKFILEEENATSKARLITTDIQGKVWFIYFNGTLENKDLGNFSEKHFFDYKDVDANGKKDYIFLDRNILTVKNEKDNILFLHKFENDIEERPVYYHFSKNDRKIGVTSAKSGDIYLFNSSGKLYKGFPLKGHTLFSIGKLGNNVGKFNLIVGNNDNFLYNYTVH